MTLVCTAQPLTAGERALVERHGTACVDATGLDRTVLCGTVLRLLSHEASSFNTAAVAPAAAAIMADAR
jgi:hypothetical protein